MASHPVCGLILTGGGARAAYQVGVLRALKQMRPRDAVGNPFPVITGTSAGAINAAALAASADDFDLAVARLVRVWRDFHAHQVYRADAFGVARAGARWLTMMSLGWALARWWRQKPRSLLDNAPLEELLRRMIPLERIPSMLAEGHLAALALSASSYSSGEHVTFYQSAGQQPPWVRSQRRAQPCQIGVAHLLASSAIPFVFPARSLMLGEQPHWFGDGSMRQVAPISPAIQLGAERVMVIGAGRLHEPAGVPRRSGAVGYPSLAQIAGHAMSSIFLDALSVDIERLQRVNRTLSLLPAQLRARSGLRPIEVLVIAPSQRIDDIAARHVQDLPTPVRALLRGVGVQAAEGGGGAGSALASYLLFEPGFTRELMALGESDTLGRRDEVARFFGWHQPRPESMSPGHSVPGAHGHRDGVEAEGPSAGVAPS